MRLSTAMCEMASLEENGQATDYGSLDITLYLLIYCSVNASSKCWAENKKYGMALILPCCN